jgi:hypothetical protein
VLEVSEGVPYHLAKPGAVNPLSFGVRPIGLPFFSTQKFLLIKNPKNMYSLPNLPATYFSFIIFIGKHFISFQRGFVNLPRKWRSQWPLAI